MPLYWISKNAGGAQRYFLQEASWPIFANLRAMLAGFPGKPDATIALDRTRERKVPKAMRGRVLSQREAEALLKRFGG